MLVEAEQKIHRFEAAGLGKAPFRCIGVNENVYRACPGAPAQPGGCCAYCGMGIRYEYMIVSADGKGFTVGCDCVAKVGDAGLKKVVDQERRRIEAAARHQREDARIVAGVELFAANRERLRALPHPYAYHAERRRNFEDYILWMLDNSGRSGKLTALSLMRKVLDRAASP